MPLGTIVFTETTVGTLRKIVATWTSGSSGEDAVGTTANAYAGKVYSLETDPTDGPTDNYHVTVADSRFTDVLAGAGLNRDTTTTETVLSAALGTVPASSALTFTISGAGVSKNGVVTVYIAGQLTAYATAAEYRLRTGDQTTGVNATLDAQLLGVSRWVEEALAVMPGYFNPHVGTYIFDGSGERVLYLRDREGRGYCLTAIDADSLKIDSDLDGAFDDFTLDLADAFVRGLPENAASASKPFTALELLTGRSSTISLWPRFPGNIEITGTFGWAAVPDQVVELVCHRTQELREHLKAGGVDRSGFAGLPSFDGGEIRMRPNTAWLWREVEYLIGARMPV